MVKTSKKITSLGMKLSQITSSLHAKLNRLFNIHYECNDARDDYSKLLKQQNTTDGVFPHWFRADDNDNFDGDNDEDGGDFTVHEEYEADKYTSIGKKG